LFLLPQAFYRERSELFIAAGLYRERSELLLIPNL
jgi:hypothetical protein